MSGPNRPMVCEEEKTLLEKIRETAEASPEKPVVAIAMEGTVYSMGIRPVLCVHRDRIDEPNQEIRIVRNTDRGTELAHTQMGLSEYGDRLHKGGWMTYFDQPIASDSETFVLSLSKDFVELLEGDLDIQLPKRNLTVEEGSVAYFGRLEDLIGYLLKASEVIYMKLGEKWKVMVEEKDENNKNTLRDEIEFLTHQAAAPHEDLAGRFKFYCVGGAIKLEEGDEDGLKAYYNGLVDMGLLEKHITWQAFSEAVHLFINPLP